MIIDLWVPAIDITQYVGQQGVLIAVLHVTRSDD